MRAINLTTNQFQFKTILNCRINKQVNQHFTAMISGYIAETTEAEILKHSLEDAFHIKAHSEDGQVFPIFKGFIQDISIVSEGGLKKMTVRAMSNTGKLDNGRHLRTFQSAHQTWKDVADVIRSFDKNIQVIYNAGHDVRTNGLVVQYKESDWDFLKRLAAENRTVLVPDCTNDFICYYFGCPVKRGETELNSDDYIIRRYRNCDGKEENEYIVTSRENADLCENVVMHGEKYQIYEIRAEMHENEMIYHYYLRKTTGFAVKPDNDKRISGASIIGKVTEVKAEKVRVTLNSDYDYCPNNRLWFPFATVYSSPDGTGWYCMPEKGDRIRMYFPDEREKRAYVISAVHLEDQNNLRKNPDEKFIRTKYDKEIRLSPDRILITNHKGSSISIDDEMGIRIKSDKEVHIAGETSVQINSGETVAIEGRQGVYLRENQNLIMVRNGIKEKAMQIEHR